MQFGRRRVAKDQLWRGSRLADRLSRLRFFRGHGVHSPFIYSIARDVFMTKRLRDDAVELFDKLKKADIKESVAIEIANLALHCNLSKVTFDLIDNESELVICSKNSSEHSISTLCKEAEKLGIAVVILSPYTKKSLCNSLLQENRSSSIDRFNYMILFNNYLPKQHFKL